LISAKRCTRSCIVRCCPIILTEQGLLAATEFLECIRKNRHDILSSDVDLFSSCLVSHFSFPPFFPAFNLMIEIKELSIASKQKRRTDSLDQEYKEE